ncbi:MAG TPA: class I SAM-dependent methyltransferase [Solirubrobacterales bacterium]|nr:class I SAM-dependent methyltransferase [Solirubrobacterales bacterium]
MNGSAVANQRVFEGVAPTYDDLALKPAERTVLGRFAATWGDFEMLDLGVGAGRTGWTFAPLVRRYVGIDYAPPMVERARRLLGDDPNVTVEVGDARDLSTIDGSFDFILFSFNGIDAVGHEDRLAILRAVRGKLKPSGHFLFSSHQLGALPLDRHKERDPRRLASPAYRAYAALDDFRHGRRADRVNAKLDLGAARERGWTIVPRGHNFSVEDYYVDPEFQLGQLRECGLEAIAILDTAGREVKLPFGGRDPWLDYLCRPLPGDGA